MEESGNRRTSIAYAEFVADNADNAILDDNALINAHGMRPMRFLVLCVFFILGVMLFMQFLAARIWAPCLPGIPCKYRKSQAEIFEDVIHARVPPLMKYVEKDQRADFSDIGSAAHREEEPRDCMTPWVVSFKQHLGTMYSQPALVRELMVIYRLRNSSRARRAIGLLWNTSINFEPMIDRVAGCALGNAPLHATLCSWLDDPSKVSCL